MFLIIYYILASVFFVYFLLSTLYLLWLASAGRFNTPPPLAKSQVKRKAIILIPAYKEDSIIVDTVRAACAHIYSGGDCKIVVIAEGLRKETTDQLDKFPIKLLQVSFEKSSKARSLNASLSNIYFEPGSFVFILDADNVMQDGCLDRVNDALNSGFKAVQVHRTAKNKDTAVALLDAISEEINLNIFRRGAFHLGLSAAPMGSGMAFLPEIFHAIFSDPEILDSVAEDRQIENYLLNNELRMAFVDDAYVFDEKVGSARAFKKQRVRWMEAQIEQIGHYYRSRDEIKSRTKQYYHTVFQILLLPRVFYLLLSFVVLLLIVLQSVINQEIVFPAFGYWVALIFLYWMTLLISVPKQFYSGKTIRALLHLPLIMLTMVSALFQLKRHRKEFLHTPKTFISKE